VLVLGTDLPARASLSHGKQQLNREAVHHIEQTRFGQQLVSSLFMSSPLFLKRRALWQAAKQGIIVSLEPALEGAKAPPFKANRSPMVITSLGYSLALRSLGTKPKPSSTAQKIRRILISVVMGHLQYALNTSIVRLSHDDFKRVRLF
jgi:hypothetical protein